MKFCICTHCGNLVEVVEDHRVPLVCCGEKMKELTPNTTEAATEKHLPVVHCNGRNVTVTVGEVNHPMLAEHSIVFVVLETKDGVQRKALTPGQEPVACFSLADGDVAVAAYAYCNLHGLWKTVI